MPTTRYFAGIDLHKSYSFMTIVDKDGYIQSQQRHEHTDDSLLQSLLQYEAVEAVVESTYGWYWLADKLEQARVNLKLAHPKKVNAIAGKKKTDAVDAKILADLLRTNMLPQSYIPTKEERGLKEMLRFRMNLVQQRSTFKRRLRDILRKQNLDCPYKDILGKKATAWLKELDCPYPYQDEINSLLLLTDSLSAQIDVFDRQVQLKAKNDGRATLLQTIPGVGYVLGLTLSTEIGDIHRFADNRALASYAGVVPSVRSSGDKTFYGRTGKRGNQYIRWALAEAAPHLIRKDEEIHQFYQRLKEDRGSSKAKVAVMNKLARIIYTILTKQRAYQIRQVRS